MLGLIGLKGSKFGNDLDPEYGVRAVNDPDTTSSASCKKHEGPHEEAEEIASLKERVSPDYLGYLKYQRALWI